MVNGWKLLTADVRLGSKYASSVNHQMSYFVKCTFINSGPYEKADPLPIEKTNSMPKFAVFVKNM